MKGRYSLGIENGKLREGWNRNSKPSVELVREGGTLCHPERWLETILGCYSKDVHP